MSAEGAMKWLVCVAEGDREGLTINEHTAKMAVDIRWEIERLRADAELAAEFRRGQRAEIERLRERLGPVGLEVVLIGDTGHYVSAAVKAEIDRLRAMLEGCGDAAEKLDVERGENTRLRRDIASYIKIGSELATDNERLLAINAKLVAALEWIVEDGATDARATECARAALAKAKP